MKDRSKEQAAVDAPEGAASSPQEDPRDRATGDSAQPGAQEEAGGSAEARLQELTAELDALRDRYLRTAAEYENFRRRTDRERAEGGVRAQAQVVEKLLDPLDDLQRVAHFAADTTTVEALLEGVQMVERKLVRMLEAAGLEVIDARGQPFDPALHEALMTAPAQSREEDETVGEVLQKGYQFKGILLRPARVQVKKYGE
jgi:molecular chaperone GrpE